MIIRDLWVAASTTPAVPTDAPATSPATGGSLVIWFAMISVTVAMLAVLVHRLVTDRRDRATGKVAGEDAGSDSSMTRPVLAVLLVGSVVVLASASFTMNDGQTRNLLIGGVVSLTSAAVAFYFASSNATEARRDLLTATTPAKSIKVPTFINMEVWAATEVANVAGLSLVLPVPVPDPSARVQTQSPDPGTLVDRATSVSVTV